jgi:ubiquinol oxidase
VNSFEYLNSWGFDFVSGYKHKPIPAGLNLSLEELRKGGYVMDEKQWMTVRLELLPSSPVWSNDIFILANPIPRVHRWRTRDGCSHSSPPQESSSHGMSHSRSFLYAQMNLAAQRRDSGWIHTLLEEAENERMHLMCVAD